MSTETSGKSCRPTGALGTCTLYVSLKWPLPVISQSTQWPAKAPFWMRISALSPALNAEGATPGSALASKRELASTAGPRKGSSRVRCEATQSAPKMLSMVPGVLILPVFTASLSCSSLLPVMESATPTHLSRLSNGVCVQLMQSPNFATQSSRFAAAFSHASSTGMHLSMQPLRKRSWPATSLANASGHAVHSAEMANLLCAQLVSASLLMPPIRPITLLQSCGRLLKSPSPTMAPIIFRRSSSVQELAALIFWDSSSFTILRKTRVPTLTMSRAPSAPPGMWML
mmetsp:Transcript_33153/g.77103  ORF Transcript_33153/g.77103 Transcript_33153/m.77103 type:complete len:286 (+) Transcript_33153:171-1028(+)